MKKFILIAALASVAAASHALVTAYTDLSSTVLGGTSSTDLTRVVGDDMTLAQAGRIDVLKFTVFNSASGTGSILTMNTTLNFYDNTTPYTGGALTNPLIASVTVGINFGTGLTTGFYSTVTTNLYALNINVPSKILVTQKNTQTSGTATRYGVMLFGAPTVGSTDTHVYMKGTTTTEGLYDFSTTGAGNLAMYIETTPEPTTWAALGLGAVAVMRRRRSSK